MSPPLVSVVLGFRNPGPYLRPAIESILGQTFRDLEVIAVDDGSTDGSGATLEALCATDPRLRVLRQEGLGLVPALHRGLALARGPLLGRMDADDISLPERLERQVAFLERHPEVDVLGTNMQVMTDAGLRERVTALPQGPEEIREALLRYNPIAQPTVVMRREAYFGVGGYRSQFKDAEDHDLWLRLSERHAIANLPDVLFHYRWHGEQSGFARLEQQALSSLAAVECARLRRAGRGDPAERLVGPVTWAFLEELGVEPERSSAYVARRHREAVQVLLQEGLPGQAVRVADALEAGLRTGRLVGASARFHGEAAWFMIESRRGRRLKALAHLLRWSRAAPLDAAHQAARGLARRLRRLHGTV